ncbi:MAG: 16S rRNA (guanine(527)-N(7))-methyltransferase RsmG [Clostridia bacterium]|nr:16S rRNA (guanine(527)-N(7))-methyltransferase RsmG [Clostridia bacterium]
MQNVDNLKSVLSGIDTYPTSEQLSKLSAYFDMVVEKNKQFNLTAIVDEDDFVSKHYEDSLFGASEFPVGARVLDIGCGGGFPSMPLAILREDLQIVGIDSTAKKTVFVADSARELGLSNLTTVAGRVEDQKSLFGTFDAVTARAVSSLQILLELAAPMLKVGGVFIAYKTDESELEPSKNALKVLNMQFDHSKCGTLSCGEKRAILVFKKVGKTPSNYPRQYGTIKKKPL